MKTNVNDIVLDITGFVAGLNEAVILVDAHQLPEVEETTFSDVKVLIEANFAENRILIDFTVMATAHLICDKTAEPFTQLIEGDYTALFTTSSALKTDAESDEIRLFANADKRLVLTDLVIDTLILAVPHSKISPNAPEEPLKASFGISEEQQLDGTDPRWEALRKLKSN